MSRVLEDFTEYMDTGLPHLGLKPLDPLSVPQIDFKFFDATVELTDVVLNGFKGNNVTFSDIDPEARYQEIDKAKQRRKLIFFSVEPGDLVCTSRL